MPKNFQLRIVELMCSRICHDLISPVSAIDNGVEMLQDGDVDMFAVSVELIGKSAKHALDRLSFFRTAYGSGGEGSTVSLKDIQKTLEIYSADRKINILWMKDNRRPKEPIPRDFAKLLTNVIVLAAECLPRGGVVSLKNLENERPNSLVMQLEGPQCNLRDDVKSGLNPEVSVEELTVRNVFAYFIASFALSLDRSLEIENISSDKIQISII